MATVARFGSSTSTGGQTTGSKTGFGVKEGGGTFGRRLRTQSQLIVILIRIDSSHPPSSRSSKTENRGELNRLGAGFPVPMNPETSNCSDATLRGLIVWANPAVIKLVWLPVSKNTGRLASTIGKARRWVNPLGGPVEERGGVCWAQLGGALGLPMLVWRVLVAILLTSNPANWRQRRRRPLTTSGVRPVHLKPMEAVGAPIKYLGIRGYENCTQTKDAGGWASLCLPGGRKLHCSDDAWKQLNRLGQNERFPSC
uniref:Uncharacterized protein n=1 Tax=Globodera pallida TaxID=36090 RepID=A0A183BT34_GLOPA